MKTEWRIECEEGVYLAIYGNISITMAIEIVEAVCGEEWVANAFLAYKTGATMFCHSDKFDQDEYLKREEIRGD